MGTIFLPQKETRSIAGKEKRFPPLCAPCHLRLSRLVAALLQWLWPGFREVQTLSLSSQKTRKKHMSFLSTSPPPERTASASERLCRAGHTGRGGGHSCGDLESLKGLKGVKSKQTYFGLGSTGELKL